MNFDFKILNTGLPRTGTYSLVVALRILGYKVKHCPRNVDDIAIYDAACEVIFSYNELEKKYPNSLYVFTNRKFEDWISSCHRHSINRRPNWNSFWENANMWKKIYYEKLDSLKEYDKKRLLIIDLDKTLGWVDLCNFLKKPIPSLPYPHLNKSYKLF